jgi:hypothetical protein
LNPNEEGGSVFKKAVLLIVLATLGGILIAATAQPASPVTPPSGQTQTRFEQFSSRQGGIIIKEIVDIEVIRTRFGELTIKVIRLEDSRSAEAVRAVQLRLKKNADRLEREYVATLDESELDELVKALAFMDTQREGLLKLARTYTEMTYSSVGGFAAGIYIDPRKQPKSLTDFANIGAAAAFFSNSTDLARGMTEAQRVLKSM